MLNMLNMGTWFNISPAGSLFCSQGAAEEGQKGFAKGA